MYTIARLFSIAQQKARGKGGRENFCEEKFDIKNTFVVVVKKRGR